ncbi:MAG: hypothetical protein ABIJ97_03125 [Bacteroidota bacterium]
MHDRLIKMGIAWLDIFCDLVIPEPYNNNVGEIPDIIGYKNGGRITYLIECKSSRTDFENEWKKGKRIEYGGMGNYRYYLIPEGMVESQEIDTAWGILEFDGALINVIREPEIRQLSVEATKWEKTILFYELTRLIKISRAQNLKPGPAKDRLIQLAENIARGIELLK